MGLITYELEFVTSGQEITEIPGWAPATKDGPSVDRIIGEYKDQFVAWPGCGRPGLASPPGVVPISDGDCCDPMRKWVAQSNGLTREVDPAVFGGVPRYRAHRDVNDGIQTQLPAALTSYTAQFVFVLKDITASGGLFCLGTSLASRAFLYHDTNGRLRHMHGSADEQFGTALSINTPYPCIVSFDGPSKAMRVFVNQIDTPYLAATKTNGAPASTNARYLAAGTGEVPANAEIIPYGILPFALHLDPDGLRDAMTGLVGIATL